MSLDKQEVFSVEPVAITAEDRLTELGMFLSPLIEYDLEKVFPKVEGWGWKVQFRLKYNLLKKFEALLEDCLFEGEQVLFFAKGNQHSVAEAIFLGLWANGINHTVFVLTNVRLLMLRTNSRGKPKKTFWMVYYSQILTFKGNWHGMLKLTLKDGRKMDFSSFPKLDRKTMPVIFNDALENFRKSNFDPKVSQSLENLCSHCLDQVPKDEFSCQTCGSTYWSPKELAIRSFIFPSWGDFLMGHTVIAFVEMFGGIGSWAYLIRGILKLLRTGDVSELLVPMIFFLIFNGFDAIFTYHVARKGLHPKVLPAKKRNLLNVKA